MKYLARIVAIVLVMAGLFIAGLLCLNNPDLDALNMTTKQAIDWFVSLMLIVTGLTLMEETYSKEDKINDNW